MAPNYHPSGYPELDLTSADVGRYSTRSSTHRLRERVERVEHRAGLVTFQARRLERCPSALAFEWANVYLALRRTWPAVEVDFVDFRAPLGKLLGLSDLYHSSYPELHARARETGTADLADLDLNGLTDEALTDFSTLPRGLSRPTDVGTAGSIRLSDCFCKPRSYRALDAFWERRARIARRRGTTRYVADYNVSTASLVLIHEFGHLLEATIWEHGGPSLAERVYKELSHELLGTRPESTRQWSGHLVNFPAWNLPPGPHAGRSARAATIRRTHRPVVGNRLGRYSVYSREELFAEALAVANAGADPALSARFQRIQHLLADRGLARRPT
jgi:hypothetical protein